MASGPPIDPFPPPPQPVPTDKPLREEPEVPADLPYVPPIPDEQESQ